MTEYGTKRVVERLWLQPETEAEYVEYWRTAMEQEYGLRLEVWPQDVDLLVLGLSQVRSDSGGEFDEMAVFASPDGVVCLAKVEEEI